jgi:hypothetical protein
MRLQRPQSGAAAKMAIPKHIHAMIAMSMLHLPFAGNPGGNSDD